MRNRLWLKHYRREDLRRCPLCGERIVWKSDGMYWYPCDEEPILFKFDLLGKVNIFKKNKVYENCIVYQNGDADGYIRGLLPHVYSCYDLNGYGGVKIER